MTRGRLEPISRPNCRPNRDQASGRSSGSTSWSPDLKSVIGTDRRCSTAPRLYILDSLCLPSSTSSSTSRVLSALSVRLCGSCLSTIIKSTCLGHTSSESSFHCKGFHLGKQIQVPYFPSDSHSARPFDPVHSDVWGPAPLVSKGGNKYYVIFL